MRPAFAEAPIVALAPTQINASLPALSTGKGFTVTTTEFELLQPVASIVSVRINVVC